MSATDFIKQHGVDKAREIVEGAPELAEYYSTIDGEYYRIEINAVNLKQLKRLVESVELIKKHGGLFAAKCQLDKGGIDFEWYGENGEFGLTDLDDLKQAIADYESIYSNDMGDGTHIENHVSPLCKVGVK